MAASTADFLDVPASSDGHNVDQHLDQSAIKDVDMQQGVIQLGVCDRALNDDTADAWHSALSAYMQGASEWTGMARERHLNKLAHSSGSRHPKTATRTAIEAIIMAAAEDSSVAFPVVRGTATSDPFIVQSYLQRTGASESNFRAWRHRLGPYAQATRHLTAASSRSVLCNPPEIITVTATQAELGDTARNDDGRLVYADLNLKQEDCESALAMLCTFLNEHQPLARNLDGRPSSNTARIYVDINDSKTLELFGAWMLQVLKVSPAFRELLQPLLGNIDLLGVQWVVPVVQIRNPYVQPQNVHNETLQLGVCDGAINAVTAVAWHSALSAYIQGGTN